MQDDHLWSWSEAFLQIVDGLIRNLQPEGGAELGWPRHRELLGSWHRQVDAARERYRQGHPEALRVLYHYWRTIAEDVQEQARFASETYHQLHFLTVL